MSIVTKKYTSGPLCGKSVTFATAIKYRVGDVNQTHYRGQSNFIITAVE